MFGRGGRPDTASYLFVKWILEVTPITRYGDGIQARYFTYLDDVFRGIILAGKPLTYNIINIKRGI